MKIKKVEIQAFRAYDKVENGTFDFQLGQNQYADFISLYAPNGFGKTSFYDAIEYSYTNNIDRFLKNKNNKDIAKSEKNIGNHEKQYILRNRYSNADLESYVILHTDTKKISKVISSPRRGSSDYKFDEKETENKYFREVILSQDWISGFLKEDKPEDRYKTFIEYFGNHDLDRYYNMLLSLESQNEKEIKRINDSIKGIQLKLGYEGDREILSKVNEKINLLNRSRTLFIPIDFHTTEKDLLNLTNSISERQSDIAFEISRKHAQISELDKLIIGNEEISGIQHFKELLAEEEKFKKRSTELLELSSQYDKLQDKKLELLAFQNKGTSLVKEKEEKAEILKHFDSYLDLLNREKDNNKEIEELLLAQENLNKEIINERIEVSKLDVKISNYEKEADQINRTIEELPSIIKLIEKRGDEIKSILNDIVEKKIELGEKDKRIESFEQLIAKYHSAQSELKENKLPNEADEYFKDVKTLIQGYPELKLAAEESERELEITEKRISENELFRDELTIFINKGLSIINDSKSKSCPLCNKEYDSYTELSDKVTGNKFLSEISTHLLTRKSEIEQNLKANSEKISYTIAEIDLHIFKLIIQAQSERSAIQSDVFTLREFITGLEAKAEERKNDLLELRKSIFNMTAEDFRKWTDERLAELKAKKDLNISIRAELLDKIKIEEEKIQVWIENSSLLNKDNQLLQNNQMIQDLKFLFTEYYPGYELDPEIVWRDLNKIEIEHAEIKNEIEEIKAAVEYSEKLLTGKDPHAIQSELKELELRIRSIFRTIEPFKLELTRILNMDPIDIVPEKLDKIIQDQKELEEQNLEKYFEESKELDLLSQLKENVLPFLKFEENKKAQAELKKDKLLKDKVSKKLEKEMKRVSAHMEQEIKSFFFEDLINDLYRRIDPHPEYNKVKFIPDFKDNKPKLNVCVYKEDENDKFIIPNLYFSQAQLNILSLCIFLAKALNAVDGQDNSIDCIFIDDPIQSMDSINILSTIDLLRSIVVNQEKQIILSTHDENFHNLLKKKIPSNLFKAKFFGA
jgi:exonuclease SbcC